SVTVWPKAEVGAERHAALKADIELYIRAAFRESTASDYQPTLTHPQSRFSFSRLGEELHQQFPGIDSLHFDNADIISELTIPRLSGVEVVLNA
ncbi:MAG: baseplate J/gp47 family protein, partial [Pseudomonas helleri]